MDGQAQEQVDNEQAPLVTPDVVETTEVASENTASAEVQDAKQEEPSEQKQRGRKLGSTVLSPEQREKGERKWGELKNENKTLREQVASLSKTLEDIKAKDSSKQEDGDTIRNLQEKITKYQRAFDFENSDEYKKLSREMYEEISVLESELGVPFSAVQNIMYESSPIKRSIAISKYVSGLREEGKTDGELDIIRHALSEAVPRLSEISNSIMKMRDEAEQGKKEFYDSRLKDIISKKNLNEKLGFDLLTDEDDGDLISVIGKKYLDLQSKYDALLAEKNNIAKEKEEKEAEASEAKNEVKKAKAFLQSESVKRRNSKPSLSSSTSSKPSNPRKGLGLAGLMDPMEWIRSRNNNTNV